MSKKLEGKVAIVTGAACGIGAGTALAFVQQGAKVVLADKNEEMLLSTCDKIKEKTGGEAICVVADVSKDEDNRKIVETAVSTFGGLHVSFINAGVLIPATLTDAPVITEEHIDGTFGPNFKGVVFGLKHQLPAMSKSGDKGSIIVTTSVAGTKVIAGLPSFSVYSCSKAASEMMIKYGAVEGAPLNVRVNGIAPGIVRSGMTAHLDEENVSELCKAAHLTGKPILVEDIAPLVVFLASDDARALTGSIHRCDAGSMIK